MIELHVIRTRKKTNSLAFSKPFSVLNTARLMEYHAFHKTNQNKAVFFLGMTLQ